MCAGSVQQGTPRQMWLCADTRQGRTSKQSALNVLCFEGSGPRSVRAAKVYLWTLIQPAQEHRRRRPCFVGTPNCCSACLCSRHALPVPVIAING